MKRMDYSAAIICLREMEDSGILTSMHEDALSFAIIAIEWMEKEGIQIKD